MEIVTFGCRLNTHESEVMRKHASAAGLDNAIIVNTCAVTAEAERQALQSIRKLRRENPDAKIIVTGCAAQINPEKFSAMPEVNHVIGNDAKLRAETFAGIGESNKRERHSGVSRNPASDVNYRSWIPAYAGMTPTLADNSVHDSQPPSPLVVHNFKGMERGFVQVQNGCDHRCTFCIIPFGRGDSRSVPIGAVLEQVRALAAAGYREISFTGVDLTAYGADLPGQPTLGQMIRRVFALAPELTRLRLSSLDPVEVDEDLWRLIEGEPRLMPHLHISMQSGDDMILKRMKRRHTAADVARFCERARRLRPDIAFGADIIAGFPTEDEAMFANTLKLVEDCGITWLHVFPYSARSGTPAARMPQVRGDVRKFRAARLRETGSAAVERHLDELIGKRLEVLVEQRGVGRTPTFAEVVLPESCEVGSIVGVDIIGRDGARVVANLAGVGICP